MPGPIIKKPETFKTGIGLIDRIVGVYADDPLGGLSPAPLMALDPIQKIIAKRALETMARGQNTPQRTGDILKTMQASTQDIGNLIPELPQQLRGGIRSLLTGRRSGPHVPVKGSIPYAESTASPIKPIVADQTVARHVSSGIARSKTTTPSTIRDWMDMVRERPAKAKMYGQDPLELIRIREFLEPMTGTKRHREILSMTLEDFQPLYQEMLERTGWKK